MCSPTTLNFEHAAESDDLLRAEEPISQHLRQHDHHKLMKIDAVLASAADESRGSQSTPREPQDMQVDGVLEAALQASQTREGSENMC